MEKIFCKIYSFQGHSKVIYFLNKIRYFYIDFFNYLAYKNMTAKLKIVMYKIFYILFLHIF